MSYLWLLLLPLLGAYIGALAESQKLHVQRQDIYLPHLPEQMEGFTLLQVSDLHSRSYGRDGLGLWRLIQGLDYDLLAITGDLFDSHHPKRHRDALRFARLVGGSGKAYFVEGNHEGKMAAYRESYRQQLLSTGVRVLDNEGLNLSYKDCSYRLVGIKAEADTNTLLSLCHGQGFDILLSHRPERIEEYAQAGADLVLSGHAHGGQWRFFNRGLYAPDQGLFPKYTKGCYKKGSTTLYVSSGAASHDAWIPRIHNRPCVELLRLHRG